MPRWLWVLLLGLLATLWWVGDRGAKPLAATPSSAGSAVVCQLAPEFSSIDQPRQSDVAGKMPTFRLGTATVSPLAGFSLQARVLSREDYRLGKESDYSPTDLVLGWGPMSEPGMAGKLNVRQGGRWYRYQWGSGGPPIALEQIIRHSANMHIIPADQSVAQALGRVDAGDIVRVNGWLVRIDSDDGWHWQSSLSRDDSGAGACELLYVCSLEIR